MPKPIQHYIAKILCAFFEGVASLARWSFNIILLSVAPLRLFGLTLARRIAPFYLRWMKTRRIIQNHHSTIYNKLASGQFGNPLYTIAIIGSIVFVAINIFTPASYYENAGSKSILYNLLSDGPDDVGDDADLANLIAESESGTNSKTTANENAQSLCTTLGSGNVMTKPLILQPLSERKTIQEYTINDGDTVSSIAAQFGINVNTILWENKLTAYSTIKPGQVLTILPVNGVRYTIAKNDTLDNIAKKYKADSKEILAFNSLPAESTLKIGNSIIIPNGTKLEVNTPRVRQRALVYAIPKTIDNAIKSLGNFFWPTISRHINQYFGWRHTGLDLKGVIGSPIYAADSGTVEIASWNNGGYGYQIVINHGKGKLTRYGHLSRFAVGRGTYVTKGQLIGYMGSTGRSTGPHLHFEIIVNGKRLNPLSYLNK